MTSLSHSASSDRHTRVSVPEEHTAHGFRGCPPTEEEENTDHRCVAAVDERLDQLTHSVLQDVIPGLERELHKVRGWLAMIEARDHAGTTTIPTLHGDKIAIKREGLSSGSGGGASGSDPNQSSLSWEKAITHHKLETLTTAVRVFKTALGPLQKPPHETTNPFQY